MHQHPSSRAVITAIGFLVLLLAGCQSMRQGQTRQSYSRINGSIPPGKVTAATKIELLAKVPSDGGRMLLVYRTTRPPGTRAPIHFHDQGGLTCLVQGNSTMRVEGKASVEYKAGDCFAMPVGVPMVNFSSGKENFVTLDFFAVPAGSPVWRVVEPGLAAIESQFKQAHQH